MICQQHNVAEDALATTIAVLPAVGLSSFSCSAAIVEEITDLAAWVVTAVVSSGFS